MNRKQVFYILGIEETRDLEVIQEAYRKLLPLHHPEEDQEGFRQLREAYEEAVRLAEQTEEETGGQAAENGSAQTSGRRHANPAVVRFLDLLADLYDHPGRRFQPEEWEKLFTQSGVVDLDTEEDIKRELFFYLADHYRIPSAVWRLLEERYQIRENRQAFVEFLPEVFVDFVLREAAQEESAGRECSFQDLRDYPEFDRDGEVDAFIGMLFQAMREAESEETWGAKDLTALEATGIYHPWFEMLRLRASAKEGNVDGILERMNALLAEYPKDRKLLCDAMNLCREGGFDGELSRLSTQILEWEDEDQSMDIPTLYRAYFAKGELARKEEKWEEAFNAYVEASDLIYTDEADEQVHETGKRLILFYVQKKELEDSEKRNLLEAYDRTGLHEKGIEFFERFPENIVDTAGFHYGLACLYDALGRYEGTRREISIGKELLERDELPGAAEDEEERLKYDEHKAAFLLLELSALLQEAWMDLQGSKDKLTQAMELLLEAERLAPELARYGIFKIRILRERREEGDAEQIIMECEKLLLEDPEDFQALNYMQEAYESLGMAQEVVDLYERARRIYSGEPKLYERAAAAFMAYGMYADVLGVVSGAEQAGAVSSRLRMKKIYAMGVTSRNKEQWEAALAEADALIRELEEAVKKDGTGSSPDAVKEESSADTEREESGENNADVVKEEGGDRKTKQEPDNERAIEAGEMLALAYLHRAMLYRDPDFIDDYPTEEDLLDRELSDLQRSLENGDLDDAHYRIGQVYSDKEDQEEDPEQRKKWADQAYEHLLIAAKRGRKNPWINAVLASYCEDRNQFQEAISYMLEALEMVGEDDEWSNRQYKRLVYWFRYLYCDTLVEEYAKQALKYADLSDEKYGETIEVHMDRGRIYNSQGRRKEAVREWSLALELLEDADDIPYNTRRKGWAYNGLGNAYRYQRNYEKAIMAYELARRILDAPEFDGESCSEYPYEAISTCYLHWKKEREGIACYKRFLEEKRNAEGRREEKKIRLILKALVDLSFSCGDYDGAVRYLTQRYKSLDVAERTEESWNWEKEEERFQNILRNQLCFPEAFSFSMQDTCMAGIEALNREGEPSDTDALSGYADYLEDLGEHLLILNVDDALAREYLERSLAVYKKIGKEDGLDNLYDQLMWTCLFQGEREQAGEYAGAYIRAWEAEVELCMELHISLEEAVERGWTHAKASIFVLGEYYIVKGDIKKAQEYLEKMERCPLCASCNYDTCYEQLALQAAVAWFNGDMERARKLCAATGDVLWDGAFSFTTMLLNRM